MPLSLPPVVSLSLSPYPSLHFSSFLSQERSWAQVAVCEGLLTAASVAGEDTQTRDAYTQNVRVLCLAVRVSLFLFRILGFAKP